jgi:hypothetical protein
MKTLLNAGMSLQINYGGDITKGVGNKMTIFENIRF